MDILLLVVALALMTVLAIRGVPIFYCAVIASLFVLITAGMNVVTGMTDTYVTAFANYVKSNFFIFVLGAIFGKIVEVSGAAHAIADFVVGKFGDQFIVPAIIVAGGIMSYGGISVFVCMFTLYPLMFALFEKANISRTLAPGLYFAGAGSFSGWMPGAPSIQLLLPVQAFGTTTFAAALPGFIVGVIQIAMELAFCMWFVRYTQKKGLGWEGLGGASVAAVDTNRPRPSFILSLLPMLVLIAALGFLHMPAAVGLFVGIVAALILYFKYLPWKNGIWGHLQTGFMSGCSALMFTCAVVGFGGVVQATPAFQNLIQVVTNMNGNPLLMAVLATAVLAGACGSGSGGEGLALPIIKQYFVPMGVNTEALTRAVSLSALTLDSLPQNGLVNSALSVANCNHRQSYFLVFITTVLIPLIALALLLILFGVMGYM